MASVSARSIGQVVAPNRSATASSRVGRPARQEQRVGGRKRVGDRRAEPARRPGDHRGRHAGHPTDLQVMPGRRIMEPMPPDPSFAPTQLAARAAYLLRGNDLGVMTTAAPLLYPHMWSWDAAFVAIGLAPLSVERAVVELDTLLSAQWTNGMIPHIVFANGVDGYFPGPGALGVRRRWPPTRRAPGTPRASPSRRCTRSRCSASSTTPAPAAAPPAQSPRRSSTAAGPTWCAGTAGWPRPATRTRAAGSRSTTAGSPAWTTRRAGIAPTPT